MTERDRIYFEMITIAYPLGAEYQELSGIGRLADAGYRQEEEVRKEAAREILHRIWVMLPHKDDPKASGTDLFWIETIENIADDFGVEVQ